MQVQTWASCCLITYRQQVLLKSGVRADVIPVALSFIVNICPFWLYDMFFKITYIPNLRGYKNIAISK